MPARSPLSPDDEARLLRHLASAPPRDRCLLLLALRTGLRAIELSRITVGQVHDGRLPRTELAIPRRDLKGGRGVRRKAVSGRVIPLGLTVRSAISDYISARSADRLVAPTEPLFLGRKLGLPLQPWGINHMVKRTMRSAGCMLRFAGSHSLRKSFARRLYVQTGHDIVLTQKALGHAHIETTVSYLSTSSEAVTTAILALDGRQPVAGLSPRIW